MLQRILKRDDAHRENSTDCSGFVGIEKRAVLMEVRTLGDPHLDKRKCLQIIRKLLYLLNQGQIFTKTEAAAALFPVTKLFQFQDIHLRKMAYLIAKELSPTVDEVMVVTTSLLKDINSRTSTITYRANAIRLLSRITNGTCSNQTEEYLKEAILDYNPMVSSAALVSAINLLKTNPGLCNKLTKQVGKAVRSQAALVQFHALCLLFRMKQNDLLAVQKLVSKYTGEILSLGVDYPEALKRQGVSRARESIAMNNEKVIHSPLGLCLVARNIRQVTRKSHVSAQKNRVLYSYLKSCVYHEAEMVALEGFRWMGELRDMTTSDLAPAMTALERFFESTKPVLRFAAFRAFDKVLKVHGQALHGCGSGIEMGCLISDNNILNHFVVDRDSWKQKNKKDEGKEAITDVVTEVVVSQLPANKDALGNNIRKRIN